MSIARAFTTRRNKPDMEVSTPVHIGRAASHRNGRPVIRAQISSPVVLVSTSNILLNNAQHIAGTAPIEIRSVSGASSVASSSGDDSDASTGSIHSRETVTDASSVDESPLRTEPEPNHLSCYFKPNVDTRHQSAREAFRETGRNSHDMFSSHAVTAVAFVEAPKEGPFGRELAQLDEVAEEFGHVVRDAEAEADMKVINQYGLAQFGASDYLNEIQSLIYDTFMDEPTPSFGGWI
jgi:hypothetical protein